MFTNLNERLISSRGVRRAVASAILVTALGAMASCDCETCTTPPADTKTTDSGSKTPGAAADAPKAANKPAETLGTPDAVYVVRGEVVELPDPKDPSREFRVKHEAIDDFKQSDGKVIGMGSMEMYFPLKDDSLIADVKVGDKLELTFEDYYKPRRKYFVSKIVKLPPDTKLEFREANPAK
jgi:Cu/Ag efflux protein CusF